jgi:outer membrane protein assembly factor BamE (lipoprotein component of BamABCDE complex)
MIANKTTWIGVAVAALTVVFGVAAHGFLLDGLDGWMLSALYEDDTRYAPQYSDKNFRALKPGMSQSEVAARLGQPLHESWLYQQQAQTRLVIEFSPEGYLRSISGLDKATVPNLTPSMSWDTVASMLGPPSMVVWACTETPNDRSYRVRTVVFRSGVLQSTRHEYYLD